MDASTDRRTLALLHLICSSCVGNLDCRVSTNEADLGKNTFHRALKGSVGRLLDAPFFSRGLINSCDFSWKGKNKKDSASGEAAIADDKVEVETDGKTLQASGHCQDWSSVGYDPKYRTIRRLNEQEELCFVALAKAGDRFAQQKLIVHHLPLLKMVARRYADKGLSLSELVNEGIFGLVRAINRFDIRRKFRFGTYAKWWIRDAIEQALLKQSRLIRLPGYVVRAQGQQHADVQEVDDDGRTVVSMGKEHGEYAANAVHELNDHCHAESAWDERAEDKTEGVDAVTPETAFDEKQRLALLERGLAQLSERERQVVVRRFGLYNDAPDTLEAVAVDLGVSYERIRQIQKSALAKLKSLLTPHGIWSER